jgi:hypothetical protein
MGIDARSDASFTSGCCKLIMETSLTLKKSPSEADAVGLGFIDFPRI